MELKEFKEFKEFKDSILKGIEECPPFWRKGQKIFNFIDQNYDVARAVQFDKGVDCFYNDELIDPFIEESFKLLPKS